MNGLGPETMIQCLSKIHVKLRSETRSQGYTTFSCSTQLSLAFILPIYYVIMPTLVGMLTFISRKNTTFEDLKAK